MWRDGDHERGGSTEISDPRSLERDLATLIQRALRAKAQPLTLEPVPTVIVSSCRPSVEIDGPTAGAIYGSRVNGSRMDRKGRRQFVESAPSWHRTGIEAEHNKRVSWGEELFDRRDGIFLEGVRGGVSE